MIFIDLLSVCELSFHQCILLPTHSIMTHTTRSRPGPTRRRKRRGAAAIEFAFILPVLVVLTLGTIDLCSVMFLKESVTLAAYEGARRGVGRGQTNSDVFDRATEFLDERGISYDSEQAVSISNPGFGTAETLENVTVTVQVPCDGNLLLPSQWFDDLTVSASVTMRKEYANLN